MASQNLPAAAVTGKRHQIRNPGSLKSAGIHHLTRVSDSGQRRTMQFHRIQKPFDGLSRQIWLIRREEDEIILVFQRTRSLKKTDAGLKGGGNAA